MRKLNLFILLNLIGQVSFGQSVNDSLKNIPLKEVVVFASKLDRYAPGNKITTIDSTSLNNYRNASLSDILQRLTPIYIKNYGQGMLSSISFRGTSANQTAVIWNGFSIIQPTTGQSDFAIVPVYSVNQIAVQYGNSGANYGSGGIGGAILLNNAIDFSRKQIGRVQSEYGSFGNFSTIISGDYTEGKLSMSTGLFYHIGKNNFPYKNTYVYGTPKVNQENAAINQWGFTQNIAYKLKGSSYLSLYAWYNHSDRELQRPMGTDPANDSKQADNSFRVMSEWRNENKIIGNSSIKVAYFNDLLHYQSNSDDSYSKVRTYQAQARHELIFGGKLFVSAGGEFQHFVANVDGYSKTRQENRSSFFLLTRYQPLHFLDISFNSRQAFIENYSPPFTPALGINIHLIEKNNIQIGLKSNVSKSYRVPTLNERFWAPGGNPNLLPETSKGYELGLISKFNKLNLHLETEITYFHNDINNWVQWIPVVMNVNGSNRTVYSPVNLFEVKSEGIELSARITYKQKNNFIFSTGISYAYTSAQQIQSINPDDVLNKQIIYVPKNAISNYYEIRYKTWVATLQANYTDSRYGIGYNRILKPYFTGNAMIGKTIGFSKIVCQINAKVNNISNTIYQTYEAYAMPGINYSVGVNATWKK